MGRNPNISRNISTATGEKLRDLALNRSSLRKTLSSQGDLESTGLSNVIHRFRTMEKWLQRHVLKPERRISGEPGFNADLQCKKSSPARTRRQVREPFAANMLSRRSAMPSVALLIGLMFCILFPNSGLCFDDPNEAEENIRNGISKYLNSVVPISAPMTLQFGPVPSFEFEVEIKWSNRSKGVWPPWQGWSTRVQGSLAKWGDQMRWTLSHRGRTNFIGGYSGSALEHFKLNFVTDRFGNFTSPGALDKSVMPISERINELVGKPIVSGKIKTSVPKLNVIESIEKKIFPGFRICSDSTDIEVLGTAILSGRKCILVHVSSERQLKRDSDYGSIKQEQYILIDVMTCLPHIGAEVARIFRFGQDGIINYIRATEVKLSYVKW